MIAINKGNIKAITNLARCYFKMNDINNMEKYYLMAIEKDSAQAMNNFARYYNTKNDYENMKKYYIMAIRKNSAKAMFQLGMHYKNKNDYDNMLTYFLMILRRDDKYKEDVIVIITGNTTIMKKIMQMMFNYVSENNKLISINKTLTDENTHLKYMPGGIGFTEAKQNFESKIHNLANM